MTYHGYFSQVRTNDIFLSISHWIYFSDSLAWQGSIVLILQVEETKATVTQKTHSDRASVLTCTQLLLPMHFSFLCISVFCPYFPSTAHTEPYFKSQHFHEHESQSMWSWSCTQLLITCRKAGWTILPNCTQKWNSLRSRIQNII